MSTSNVEQTRPSRRRRVFKWIAILTALASAFALFRQGYVPLRLLLLPPLDLAKSNNWFVDWRLAEISHSRALCKVVISAPNLTARQISDRPLVNGCGWVNAVSMSRVGGARLPTSRLTCEVASALALWMTHEVQPLASELLGSRVVKVRQMGTYSCRNIIGNSRWTTRRSEHASANAIDLGAFTLANGTVVSVKRHWKGDSRKARFLHAIHARACRYFRVSLSPNYNAAHHDHFHFDRGMFSVCR